MMKHGASFAISALAAGAMLSASPAFAQSDELDPQAVEAAARYALPIAFDAYVVACSTELDPQGYALQNSDSISEKFAEGQDESWPAAKEAMLQIIAEGEEEEMAVLFDTMGDEALRPFVDALVGSLIAQEIKLDDCGVIERGLEILDPMPAENVAQLAGFLVEMGQRDEAAEDDGEWEASE